MGSLGYPSEPMILGDVKVPFFYFFYFEGFTSIPTALTANDRNRLIENPDGAGWLCGQFY